MRLRRKFQHLVNIHSLPRTLQKQEPTNTTQPSSLQKQGPPQKSTAHYRLLCQTQRLQTPPANQKHSTQQSKNKEIK